MYFLLLKGEIELTIISFSQTNFSLQKKARRGDDMISCETDIVLWQSEIDKAWSFDKCQNNTYFSTFTWKHLYIASKK